MDIQTDRGAQAPLSIPAGQTIDLPMQTREARFMPSTVDEEARTIELTWTTGATVRRVSWFDGPFDEQLVIDEGAVRLDRLNNGASLLDSHSSYRLSAVLGVVERGWMQGSGKSREGRAIVRFSEREDVDPVWRDVKAGIIRNVSVGYAIHRTEKIDRKDNKIPLMRVVDWEPLELSLVSVPADAGAQVRAQERVFPCSIEGNRSMSKTDPEAARGAVETDATNDKDENKVTKDAERKPDEAKGRSAEEDKGKAPEAPAPAAAAAQPISEDEIRRRVEAGIVADRERAEAIRNACRTLKFGSDVAEEMVRSSVPLDTALKQLMNRAVERDDADRIVKGAPRVVAGEQDEEEMRAAAIRSAILHRYSPSDFKIENGGERYVGLSLLEIGRHCLEEAGVRTAGLARTEVAKRALMPGYGVRAGGMHTTSDFANVLADVANKTLRAAYDQSARTFVPFTRRTTAPDFKSINRTQLGEAPQLLSKNEHGEFVRGTIGDAKETYALVTYGRVFAVTREVIINDDLDAFTRVPALFGNAAAQKESDVVWAIITANAAMGDGTNLFDASHNNVGTGGAISVTTVGEARELMRTQRGLDGETLINVQPAFLIVPAALETVAEQFLSETLMPSTTAAVVPVRLRRSLELIVEPRLDPNSQTAWYVSASPAQIDTIEYCFLEGEEGVMIDSRMGFDVDGMEIRARLDFAAKAIDHRGLVKNAGA